MDTPPPFPAARSAWHTREKPKARPSITLNVSLQRLAASHGHAARLMPAGNVFEISPMRPSRLSSITTPRRTPLLAALTTACVLTLGASACERVPTQQAVERPTLPGGPLSAIGARAEALTRGTPHARVAANLIATANAVRLPNGSVELGFDDLPDGASVGAAYKASYGVTFSGATVLTAGGSLNSPYIPRSGTRVVYDPSGMIEVTFDTPVIRAGGYVTGRVAVALTCYKENGSAVGSAGTPGANYGGSGTGLPLNLPVFVEGVSMKRCRFFGAAGGNSFTIDDFTFTEGCDVTLAAQLQNDPAWGNDIMGVGPDRMKLKGCAITSVAMGLMSRAIPYSAGALNTFFKTPAGAGSLTASNGVVWPTAIAKASFGLSRYQAVSGRVEMDKALCAGYPVIVVVPGQLSDMHFVVVTGKKDQSTYKVNNPASGAGEMSATSIIGYRGAVVPAAGGIPWNQSVMTLAGGTLSRSATSLGINTMLSADATGTPPDLVLSVDNATLLVTDPSGNRVGWLGDANATVHEIAEPSLWYDAVSDDETGEAATSTSAGLQWSNAREGSYDLRVTAQRTALVTLTIQSLHYGVDVQDPPMQLRLLAIQGQSVPLTVVVGANGAPSMTRAATPQSVREDVDAAAALGLLTNAGIQNALQQKLDAVEAARVRGNKDAALGALSGFEALVTAQTANHLAPDAATVLLEDAAAIRAAIGS